MPKDIMIVQIVLWGAIVISVIWHCCRKYGGSADTGNSGWTCSHSGWDCSADSDRFRNDDDMTVSDSSDFSEPPDCFYFLDPSNLLNPHSPLNPASPYNPFKDEIILFHSDNSSDSSSSGLSSFD